ncbi:phosphoenolpyruvate carboxykinase (ATP) [Synchytrium microbalum]|uniref:Phosphoenolpyruvate carboxykinase (ATP) n=1 Tax=Synchytrium microbalum TaxID=1806994 RepID=A0A507BXX7_9FUNG|nr:phosphoenolpyruvate carboxykinase (ATP) [Synchytrium microbalum]TPX33637.1 phosphoenolpyruvate carboxykinase (ATP) [Synchytrium microbalum]
MQAARVLLKSRFAVSARLPAGLTAPARRWLATPAEKSEQWQSSLEKVGLDTTHIPFFRNPSNAQCYEDAIKYEPGTFITSAGALSALSGAKTGRSPNDKRIVDEKEHTDNVWWGPVNMKLAPDSFAINRQRALDYLNTRERLYVVDAFAGWDPKYRLKIRIVCARAYHATTRLSKLDVTWYSIYITDLFAPQPAHFMWNMLIRPTAEEAANFGEPDFTIFNSGQFSANKLTPGMTSSTSVSLSFDRREMVILGSQYAGEMKKGVFTVMHYLMPRQGVLSLHTSANEGMNPEKDVSLFFGLSGTGKTTLSADPHRALIGDDEHCWSDQGIFNIEGGCYAKAIDLSAEKEPEIFSAIRFGSILENIILDPKTRVVDYTSKKITENTRACYPIDFIPNAKIPCVGGHPKNIILLTCDAFGVLPPVSKLTSDQAQYHFISGYTAKIAGTEVGVTEPQATFSACYGAPFLVFHPIKYANMLAEKLAQHKTNVWLINTGWTGGKYGVGNRISLKHSRAIIDAIHDGSMDKIIKTNGTTLPVFNLAIPKGGVKNVPDSILNPASAWSSKAAFDSEVKKLAHLFTSNFEKFKDGKGAAALVKAGPVL